MTIGERIKQRRKQIGMSAEELARRTGKSPSTIYRYENGDIRNVDSTALEPIADVLGIAPGYLMGWTEEEIIKSTRDYQTGPFSDRVTAMMVQRGISVEDMAEALNMSIAVVENIINDPEPPEEKVLIGIARLLLIDAAWLSGDSGKFISYLEADEYEVIRGYRKAKLMQK